MIIGSGLIAKSLQHLDTENTVYFASGVSNSLETRNSEFERELSLLRTTVQNNKNSRLVYFSTLSVHDQSKQTSPYVLHKLQAEDLIKNISENYLILRIGNIVGPGGNPNTLFNFLKNRISGKTLFTLHKKARRILVDIDDIPRIFKSEYKHLNNRTVNFSYPYYYSMNEIIEAMEEQLGTAAIYQEKEEGDFYPVAFDDSVTQYYAEVNAADYLKLLIKKYL